MEEKAKGYQVEEKPRNMPEKHQPVVICIDTSESMNELAEGTNSKKCEMIEELVNSIADLKGLDDRTKSCVDICILLFDDTVRTLVDWKSLSSFQGDVKLDDIAGQTFLGDAVEQCIEKTRQRRAVYASTGTPCRRPQIFIYTDGESTQDLSSAYDKTREYLNKTDPKTGKTAAKVKMYITLIPPARSAKELEGFGPSVTILRAEDCANGLPAAFKFMEASVVSASSVTGGEATTTIPKELKVYTGNDNTEVTVGKDGTKTITTDTDDVCVWF